MTAEFDYPTFDDYELDALTKMPANRFGAGQLLPEKAKRGGAEQCLYEQNVLGKDVLVANLDFSFYFSSRLAYGNSRSQHGIRVKVAWNQNKMYRCNPRFTGELSLAGCCAYIAGPDVSQKQLTKAIEFFLKYRVLFAAVWDEALDANWLKAYFLREISLDDLIRKMHFKSMPTAELVRLLYNATHKPIVKKGRCPLPLETQQLLALTCLVRKHKLFNLYEYEED